MANRSKGGQLFGAFATITFLSGTISPHIAQAQVEERQGVEILDDLIASLRNLNSASPFTTSNDYAKIRALVTALQKSARENNGLTEADFEKIRELRTVLTAQRRAFVETISSESGLSSELRDAVNAACNFDRNAERRLENLITALLEEPDGVTQRQIVRANAPNAECESTLRLISNTIEEEIRTLESEIDGLIEEERILEERIRNETDPEKKAELEQELEEKKSERREKTRTVSEKKKVKGKIDTGLLISGLLNMAIGYALTVYSAGTLAAIGQGLIRGGGAMAFAAVAPAFQSQTEETRREVGTGDFERDVNSDYEPTEEQRTSINEELSVADYVNVSADQSGNFAVYRHPDGTLKIYQIAPKKLIATINPDHVMSVPTTVALGSLPEIQSMKVTSISDVGTAIKIDFVGEDSAGRPVVGRVVEHEKKPEFAIIIEPA